MQWLFLRTSYLSHSKTFSDENVMGDTLDVGLSNEEFRQKTASKMTEM
jgi:hypothetical protein